MSRVKHSLAGYIRRLQISKNQLFIFVEGTENDQFVYGMICKNVCSFPQAINYSVRAASELPYKTGGKCAIVKFYRYARKKKNLVSELNGKKTALAFCLDKDIDDLMKSKCKSDHVIYTRFYDIQNHIYLNSNFILGVSSALSIDPSELSQHSIFNNWCSDATKRWREWIIICIISIKHESPIPNYRLTSQINKPLNGRTDSKLYEAALNNLKQKKGWTQEKLEKELKKVEVLVDNYYLLNSIDILFKGKWYSTLLELDLRDYFSSRPLQLNGVGKRATSSLSTTLDFSQPWTGDFAAPLKKITSKLM
jgi:hypothetical protein